MNERWVGLVVEPHSRRLEWPTRTAERPFGVKIDFELPYDDESTLIGFHTKHLIHNASLTGVQQAPDVDYVAVELRKFIDTCTTTTKTSTARH